jgi:hypothetical protein
MSIFSHLFLYCSVFAVGFLLCNFFDVENRIETWGLSWLLGMGFTTFIWFLMYFPFQIAFSRFSLVICLCLSNIVLFIANIWRKKLKLKSAISLSKVLQRIKHARQKIRNLSMIEKILLFFLFVIIFFVFVQDFFWPVTDWDALALYDFRAKVLLATGTLATGKDLGYFFQYPLFTSLLHAASYFFGLQEAKIWYAFVYQAFLSLFYVVIRRRSSREISLLGVVFLAISPAIFGQALKAYTNLSYTAYESMGFIYFWQWLETRKNKDVLLAGILVGLGTWVRMTEPFYLFAVVIIFFGCLKHRRVQPAAILAGCVALFTRYPWDKLISLTYQNPLNTPVSALAILPQLSIASVMFRIGEVGFYVTQNIFPLLGWYVLLALLVIANDFRQKNFRLFLPFLTVSAFLGMIFSGTLILSFTLESWNRIGDSLTRMSIFLLPLFLYIIFCGTVWQQKNGKKKEKHKKSFFQNFFMKIPKIQWWKFIWLMIPAFLYLSPFLLHPAFNVIDDGASLLVAKKLLSDVSVQNWSNLLIETSQGRLRPLYHIYFLVIYFLSGINPLGFWVAQAFMLGATLWLGAKLLLRITNSWIVSAIVPLFLFALPVTAENFYRLGTAEPRQMLLWIIFMLWLVGVEKTGWTAKKTILGSLILLAALLMKETSVVFILPVVVVMLWKILLRKCSWSDLAFSSTLGLVILGYVLLLTAAPQTGVGYSGNFHFHFAEMKQRMFAARIEHAVIFFGLSIVSAATALRFVVAILKKHFLAQQFLWQVILITQILAMLVIGIFPWQFQLSRYFYPIYLFVLLYGGIEVAAWKQWLHYPKMIFCCGILLVIFAIFSDHVLFLNRGTNVKSLVTNAGQSAMSSFDTYQVSYGVISYLLTQTPNHAQVFISASDYEVIFELGLYASHLRERDVTVFTTNQQLVTDLGNEYSYLHYVKDPVAAFLQSSAPKILLLRQQDISKFSELEKFSKEEKEPAATFHTIPKEANWVVVQEK